MTINKCILASHSLEKNNNEDYIDVNQNLQCLE